MYLKKYTKLFEKFCIYQYLMFTLREYKHGP